MITDGVSRSPTRSEGVCPVIGLLAPSCAGDAQ
jgi:hypothetical protein